MTKNNRITMTDRTILPKGYDYSYTDEINKIAMELGGRIVFSKTPEGKFYIYIDHVFKKISEYQHTPVHGFGTTLEDASQDYMRMVRGENLLNIITNKEGNFV